jgi:nitrile hydratase subunit beta
MEGFGPVEWSRDEPVFAEDWERGAFRASMTVTAKVQPNGGAFRHSIERMDPAQYLSSSYYEHWLTGAASLLVESGLVSHEELQRRANGRFPLSRPDRGASPASPALPAPRPPAAPPADAGQDAVEARFAVGDRVRVREWHPLGHTRAPRYVQGKRGVIVRVDGPANFPDMEAHGGGKVLDPTYSVGFSAWELWGQGGADGETVHVDLWERYLEEGD